MTATDPQVRVRYMQIFVRRIDQLPPEDRDAIRANAPTWVFPAVREGAPLDWLPGEVNTELTGAVSRRLDTQRAHAFYKYLLINVFDSPLLNAFVEGALRMAGKDPGKALKWVPKGFGMMFRNWGTWSVARVGDGEAAMEVTRLPGICRDREGIWAASARDSLHSIFVRAGRHGAVTIGDRDDRRGYVRYDFRWE